MIMAGPDVLGFPASPATIAGIALIANTCVLVTSATLAGLIILSLTARIHAASLSFITDLEKSLRGGYSLLIIAILTSLFVAMFAAYLSGESELAMNGSSWLVDANRIMPPLTIARSVFFLAAAIASGGMVLAIAGYLRNDDERATIFGLRVICGAVAVGACTRLIELWITYAHHPSVYIPGLAITIAVGILIATSLMGSAILGILRPQNPLWLMVTAAFLLASFAASSSIDIKLATAARLATSPTFDAAMRPQPTMMVFFFICAAGALTALALMLRWWVKDTMPDARRPMPEKTS